MKRFFLILPFLALGLLLAACGRESGDGATPSSKGVFLWVQALKGHPVHQMTQIAFLEGCRQTGYEGRVIGTDGPDIAGTIALAEQAITMGRVAGVAIWTGNPAYNPLIEKISRRNIPVILPHFPMPEGSVPGASGIISCDPAEYARETAQRIGTALGGKGTVALTQGSFNQTENLVMETFAQSMKQSFPNIKVLPPEEEGFDPSKSIAKAVAILQANPEVNAAFSSTGGGPTTWAGARKETKRPLLVVGMDYTRVNLDLVKNGEIFAVVGQPLWEESLGSAELLAKWAAGAKKSPGGQNFPRLGSTRTTSPPTSSCSTAWKPPSTNERILRRAPRAGDARHLHLVRTRPGPPRGRLLRPARPHPRPAR
jgi:ribose transport system substrate-binding protein